MAGASSLPDASANKIFSGETEDGREYKRWKTWITNKLLTLDTKVPAKAHGAYVYTLLAGKALECVEHLEPAEYQKEGGEEKLFKLLDARFPQQDVSDEMSEVLTEVFSMKALEGESLKVWIARAGELFDKCARKCKVDFPTQARGWLLLNRSGLNEEQKAVVLARSGGSMTKDDIGRAMRSCYPEYTVSKRRFGASLVENDEAEWLNDAADPLDEEVEAFLAEHGSDLQDDDSGEIYEEAEVVEALAVSWKEKRKELTRLQRSRRFGAAQDPRKSYRVEIEELKKKTKCHKCHQVGHWSRECRQPGKGKSKGSGGPSSKPESGAALVEEFQEHFVAMVDAVDVSRPKPLGPRGNSLLQLIRDRRTGKLITWEERRVQNSAPSDVQSEVCLVSSPGFGVIDSGCGRTIVGQQTLDQFKQIWSDRKMPEPEVVHETNHFRFGNGQSETSEISVRMPVVIAGRSGTVKAAVVKGQAPLLISRKALQTLEAVIDFGANQMTLFPDRRTVPLTTNEAGQYVINVLDSKPENESAFTEVMMNVSDHDSEPDPKFTDSSISETQDETSPILSAPTDDPSSSSHGPGDTAQLQCWSRNDSFLHVVPTSGKQGPTWQAVRRRRVLNSTTKEVLFDEIISPHAKKSAYHHVIPPEVHHVTTEFYFQPQELTKPIESLAVHCQRQLKSQVTQALEKPLSSKDGKPFLVAEVFSPPRFAPLVHGVGGTCKSYDLTNGFDFSCAETRDRVAQELWECPPDLLILCPPCTDEGGWFNLNAWTMNTKEYLHRVRRSRMFIRFCCKLFEQQVEAGKQALLEHPSKGSKLWTYPEVQALFDSSELLTCHMCRYGLRIPNSEHLIRKATHLLVSHKSMHRLAKQCPGASHEKHQCHQVIAGNRKEVGSISKFAGKYTPAFVEAVMETVPRFVQMKQDMLVQCPEWPSRCQHEVLAAKPDMSEDRSDEELLKIIDKVHRNLGHPPNHDLVRILKHAQASDKAISLAHKHSCSFCRSQIRPHVPLPAKSSRPRDFNQTIGIDVKNLPGWRPNQKVKALNIVDQASCYQLMIPFYVRETSELIRKLVADHWVRIFGPPKEVIVDQAQTNLGDPLQTYLESIGSHVHQIAGEAHWQLPAQAE